MADAVNMSLDDIIQQNKQRASRTRGRGGGTVWGRGGGRGRGRGRGRGNGNFGGGGSRGASQTRSNTPGRQGRSRSRSRGPQGYSQFQEYNQPRSRSQSRARSRSRQQRRSASRARSGSRSRTRSQLRGLTPRGRAGLDYQQDMPPLVRSNRFNRGRGWRGGLQNRLRRSNSNPNLQGSVHSRLGHTFINTRSRGAGYNIYQLAVPKRGITKRGRGLSTGNRYSNVGLRSDQMLMEQQQNWRNPIKSQTFRRSRNNSFSSATQLTVRVANDFTPRRRNSVGNAGYLNEQSLAQLNNNFGGYNTRRGPNSVKSMGSNRSNRSSRSNVSNRSKRSNRSRGRGRGRGANRGVGNIFVNKPILNPKLQKEIAAIQGKAFSSEPSSEAAAGINFALTPAATAKSLHQRFASS